MTKFDHGWVLDNGTVVLHEGEDVRRLIRPGCVDSITTFIGEGKLTLHLRDGSSVDVSYWIDDRPEYIDRAYDSFNLFCWDVEALVAEEVKES